MGYRAVKQALGETNLERKCRFLFGVCLAVLIAAAFIWVEYNAETVVMDATRTEGRNLVSNHLLQEHWQFWDTDPNESEKELLLEMIDEFTLARRSPTKILRIDQREEVTFLESQLPQDETELRLLQELKQEYLEQVSARRAQGVSGDGKSAEAAAGDLVDQHRFKERALPEIDEYHYYEPVYWKSRCLSCHYDSAADTGALSYAEGEFPVNDHVRFVRVVIPYAKTAHAINKARAGLIAAAIATVFMAMIALYVIVRYVIVKPLNHLRDVSDEVSRGNTGVRAEIQTHDEFQELGDAFNRMLRHLIEAQSELRNVNRDLDAKVDELAQVNMRLYEMNLLKSDFLANMSHELRTPLNSIIGFSEVLQGIDSLSDRQKRYAQNIQKSGRVLLEMINDILDLAKLEAGKMEVRPTEFRIDAVVSAQCDMVRSLTEEKNIDLEVHVPAGATPLFQDQSKVQQILTNLLSNAIKFTPEGGRITVTAKRNQRDRLELTVADTGVGIPEEDREIIFEKFRQSKAVLGPDGLTREFSGTGLGLSIVKELCKLLSGEITFESELGRGSTFKVVLPWNLSKRTPSPVSAKLDELTKPRREEFEPESPPAHVS